MILRSRTASRQKTPAPSEGLDWDRVVVSQQGRREPRPSLLRMMACQPPSTRFGVHSAWSKIMRWRPVPGCSASPRPRARTPAALPTTFVRSQTKKNSRLMMWQLNPFRPNVLWNGRTPLPFPSFSANTAVRSYDGLEDPRCIKSVGHRCHKVHHGEQFISRLPHTHSSGKYKCKLHLDKNRSFAQLDAELLKWLMAGAGMDIELHVSAARQFEPLEIACMQNPHTRGPCWAIGDTRHHLVLPRKVKTCKETADARPRGHENNPRARFCLAPIM